MLAALADPGYYSVDPAAAAALLKADLACPFCSVSLKSIPAALDHARTCHRQARREQAGASDGNSRVAPLA